MRNGIGLGDRPDDGGIVINCCVRWRLWLRPVVMCLYFCVLLVVLPLLIINLWEEYRSKIMVIVGGLFTILAVPISLWDITQHLVHYTKPHLQKYIIRILWMVPIYALNAWLGLMFPKNAMYIDTCRECYEAYVIYNFMMFLLTYLHDEMDLEEGEVLDNVTHINHIFPLCCLKPWPIGSDLVHRCKHGILQYTVIRPITTIISLICEGFDVYGEGEFKGNRAYPYMIAVNNLSQFVAMYSLVLFYRANREALRPMKPIGKFLCIKAVVFFSFFQGVIIAILGFAGVFDNILDSKGSADQDQHFPQAIQNFLICIEMFLAAVAHHFSFSYRSYVDLDEEQHGCCFAFLHMWDISDVRRDFAEHVNVIGASVRRRVFGRHGYHGVSSRDSGRRDNEKQALLQPIASDSNPIHSMTSARSYQAMTDSDHEGISAGLKALEGDRVLEKIRIESPPRDYAYDQDREPIA